MAEGVRPAHGGDGGSRRSRWCARRIAQATGQVAGRQRPSTEPDQGGSGLSRGGAGDRHPGVPGDDDLPDSHLRRHLRRPGRRTAPVHPADGGPERDAALLSSAGVCRSLDGDGVDVQPLLRHPQGPQGCGPVDAESPPVRGSNHENGDSSVLSDLQLADPRRGSNPDVTGDLQ